MSATIVTTLPPEVEIEIIAGSSKTLEVSVVDKDGVVVDLTGATAYFTVKQSVEDVDALIAKASTTPAQITITDAPNGKFRVFLSPSDTASMDVGQYICDMWVVLTTGKRYPIISPSVFEVKPRVTVLP